jgi:hypothetical protein
MAQSSNLHLGSETNGAGAQPPPVERVIEPALVSSFTPLLDVASARHTTLYPRLSMS